MEPLDDLDLSAASSALGLDVGAGYLDELAPLVSWLIQAYQYVEAEPDHLPNADVDGREFTDDARLKRMRDVLHHPADWELAWRYRLRLVLAQNRPMLTGYDQDLWADRLNYADADPDEAMSVFTLLRRANLKLIDRATPADLKRVGVHSERGEESIEYLLGLYAGHDLLHLRQIERIRASLAR